MRCMIGRDVMKTRRVLNTLNEYAMYMCDSIIVPDRRRRLRNGVNTNCSGMLMKRIRALVNQYPALLLRF